MRLRAFGRPSACRPRRVTSCCSRAGCVMKCRRQASPASVSRLASTTPGLPRAPPRIAADGIPMRFLLPLCGLLLALCAGAGSAPAADCPLDLGRGTGWVVFSDHYMLAFRPEPMRIEVGEPFALLFNVCTKNGNAAELGAL